MNHEDIDYTYRVMVVFDEMKDGTVETHIIPDMGVGSNPGMNVMFYLAEIGETTAGLAAQAFFELCENGLVRHAVEHAKSVPRGVKVLLPNAPVPEDLDLDLVADFPMKDFSVN